MQVEQHFMQRCLLVLGRLEVVKHNRQEDYDELEDKVRLQYALFTWMTRQHIHQNY